MKIKLLTTLAIVLATTSFAQQSNNYKVSKKSKLIQLINAAGKQTRGLEQCIGSTNYTDTSAGNHMAMVHNEDFKHYYSGNRYTKPEYNLDFLWFSNVNASDKSVRYQNIFNPSLADSNIELSTYDANNRPIFTANVMFNGTGFDTVAYTKFKYTLANTFADSITAYSNATVPASIFSLQVNKVSNNLIDSTKIYLDLMGAGSISLLSKKGFSYNANNLLVQEYSFFDFSGFSIEEKNKYTYNANNLLDSIINYQIFAGIAIPSTKSKIVYDATNANGYEKDWEVAPAKLVSGAHLQLNANKKLTSIKVYEFISNTDSMFTEHNNFVFNTNNNVIKNYIADFDTANNKWFPVTDSTNYVYKPYVPSSTNTITKSMQQLSCYPNPVVSNAVIQYTSNKQQEFNVQVVDGLGKSIYNAKLQAVNGNSYFTIPTQNWPIGTYYCTVFANGVAQQSVSFVKQ